MRSCLPPHPVCSSNPGSCSSILCQNCRRCDTRRASGAKNEIDVDKIAEPISRLRNSLFSLDFARIDRVCALLARQWKLGQGGSAGTRELSFLLLPVAVPYASSLPFGAAVSNR